MALSGLIDSTHEPNEAELDALLGPSCRLWAEIVSAVSESHAPVAGLWHFGGAKYGWTLRLKRKERVIVYLIPQAGMFLAGLVLGEAAVERAWDNELPGEVKALIDRAPRYAEGCGFRMPVVHAGDVAPVLQLIAAKMQR